MATEFEACEMRRFPAENACIIVLCNRDDAPLRRVIQSVQELLFDETPTSAKPLALLPADIATALAGRYADERGTSLVIKADGAITRARIHWSPPSGPVTNATLGLDEAGKLMLNDGSPQVIAIEVERVDEGQAKSISILGRAYRRVADGAAAKPAKAANAANAADRPAANALPTDAGMNVMMSTKPYDANEHGLDICHRPQSGACCRNTQARAPMAGVSLTIALPWSFKMPSAASGR